MTDTKTKRRKSKLGRGLNSLIGDPVTIEASPDADPVPAPSRRVHAPSQPVTIDDPPPQPASDNGSASSQTNSDHSLLHLRPADLTPSPFQPRRTFDEAGLSALADSIKRSGVMQPIVVRRARDEVTGNEFEIVAGERRWRAVMQAGLDTIPAIVRDLDDSHAAELALIENVQRKDLGAMERAWGFQSLAERFSLSHAQIAQRVGLERSTITNLIRLTELEREIQELLESERLSVGHGKALLAIAPGEGRLSLAIMAAAEGWSVRKLEQAQTPAPSVKSSGGASDAAIPASRQRLEKQLSDHLGTKVLLKTNPEGNKGKIVIEFYNLDHFDGLMSRMGFEMR